MPPAPKAEPVTDQVEKLRPCNIQCCLVNTFYCSLTEPCGQRRQDAKPSVGRVITSRIVRTRQKALRLRGFARIIHPTLYLYQRGKMPFVIARACHTGGSYGAGVPGFYFSKNRELLPEPLQSKCSFY